MLVYLALIPGLFACIITAYSIFFVHENLLNVNPITYFVPIISMVVTLALVHQQVAFSAIPGIERLSALIVLIAVSFAVILAIYKTFIGVVFFANFLHLLLLEWLCLCCSNGPPPCCSGVRWLLTTHTLMEAGCMRSRNPRSITEQSKFVFPRKQER